MLPRYHHFVNVFTYFTLSKYSNVYIYIYMCVSGVVVIPTALVNLIVLVYVLTGRFGWPVNYTLISCVQSEKIKAFSIKVPEGKVTAQSQAST